MKKLGKKIITTPESIEAYFLGISSACSGCGSCWDSYSGQTMWEGIT